MTTRQLESRAQDDVVFTYRDRFGYPRLQQPDERVTAWALFAWAVVGIGAASALLWMLT